MEPVDDHQPFLDAIRANPDDDAPRLIYADWLEERDPAHAQYIRDECFSVGETLSGARGRDVARAAIKKLRDDMANTLASATFHRGFIEGVRFQRLKDVEQQLNELHESPVVSSIRELIVNERDLTEGQLACLLASRWLSGLQSLKFEGYHPAPAMTRALAAATPLPHLKRLHFGGRAFGDETLVALASSPVLETIEELTFYSTRLGSAGAAALGASPYFRRVRSLQLTRNQIGPEGAAALAASEAFHEVGAASFSGNPIQDAGLLAIFDSPHCALTHLDAAAARIGDLGAAMLASAPRAESLTYLDLSKNELGPDAARALAESSCLHRLRELFLHDNYEIETRCLMALARSPAFPHLQRLSLGALTDEAAEALLETTTLPNLKTLDAHNCLASNKTREALAERFLLNVH